MRKIHFATNFFLLSALLSMVGGEARALPSSRTLVLPPAADNSDVISLGSALDPRSGKQVEGIMYIHRRSDFARPAQNARPGGGNTTCYTYLAKGAKWKTVEPWVMNSANIDSLDETALFNLMGASLEKWEDAADGAVGNGGSVQIFGSGSSTSTQLSADTLSPDGQNEVYFADVSTVDVIAATTVWGIFSGPVSQRVLVEWDMVFDDVDFEWSAETLGVVDRMDFDNVASHEDGHAAGMGHPSDSCTEETMYRFASEGETKKRDLNSGDIAGINNLY